MQKNRVNSKDTAQSLKCFLCPSLPYFLWSILLLPPPHQSRDVFKAIVFHRHFFLLRTKGLYNEYKIKYLMNYYIHISATNPTLYSYFKMSFKSSFLLVRIFTTSFRQKSTPTFLGTIYFIILHFKKKVFSLVYMHFLFLCSLHSGHSFSVPIFLSSPFFFFLASLIFPLTLL